jgi:hypothetical protein
MPPEDRERHDMRDRAEPLLHQPGPRIWLGHSAGAAASSDEANHPQRGAWGPYLAVPCNHSCATVQSPFFTSRGRGSGLASPQAQRPRWTKRTTRSGERGGPILPCNSSCATVQSPFFTSRGRGSGLASPQAQRPPRGAANHAQRGAWGPFPAVQQFADEP